MPTITDVIGTNKEVLTGTDTTLSCTITGITQQLDKVEWKKGDQTLTTDSNYVVTPGTHSGTTQTTTLVITGALITSDTQYTCKISSTEQDVTDRETIVDLGVFGELFEI